MPILVQKLTFDSLIAVFSAKICLQICLQKQQQIEVVP